MTKEKEREADHLEAIQRMDHEEHAKLEQQLAQNQCARATMQVAEDRQKEEWTGLKGEYDHYNLSPDTRKNIANPLVSLVDRTRTGSHNMLIYRIASEPTELEAAFGKPAYNHVKQ